MSPSLATSSSGTAASGGYGHVAVVEWIADGRIGWVEQNSSASGRASGPIAPNGTLGTNGTLVPTGILHAKANVPPPPPAAAAAASAASASATATRLPHRRHRRGRHRHLRRPRRRPWSP